MGRALSLLAIAVALGGTAGAQDLDQRIPVEPGGLLQVDLDMGEEVRPARVALDVRSHDADEVWAVADVSGLGSTSVTFRIEHDERGVRLYGRSGGVMSWLFGGPSVNVRVWVPRNFSLDLRSTSGPIRVDDVTGSVRARATDAMIDVRGVEGPLNLRTRSGGVRVTEVTGEVAVRAVGGSIEVAWVTGDVEARTGRGDLRVRHVDGRLTLRTDLGEVGIQDVGGPAHVKTERGAVFASFAGAPAGDIETRRGSVEVVFPDHVGVELDARSGHGTVQVGYGAAPLVDGDSDRFVGVINGGGLPLRVYTARGSVRVGWR